MTDVAQPVEDLVSDAESTKEMGDEDAATAMEIQNSLDTVVRQQMEEIQEVHTEGIRQTQASGNQRISMGYPGISIGARNWHRNVNTGNQRKLNKTKNI